jgi:hypothetical protein
MFVKNHRLANDREYQKFRKYAEKNMQKVLRFE